MAHTQESMKGRRTKNVPSFSMLIHAYFQSKEYAMLSPRAVKALIDLYCQYRGKNNGDLCATWTFMKKVGWSSKDQLAKAIKELLDTEWIMVTRQGGRKIPTLYAVTFRAIDECGGKLDVRPTLAPLHSWKRETMSLKSATVISLPRPTGQSVPPHGSQISATASQ